MKRELVERYRGRWVAVDGDGDVGADADQLDALLTACADMGFGAEVVVHRVPEADARIFVVFG